MKQILVNLTCLVFSVAAFSQTRVYDSLLEEEKAWTIMRTGTDSGRTISYHEYKTNNNTSINDIPFKQLYERERIEGNDAWGEWRATGKYIGQDWQGKVYFYENYGSYSDNKVTMDFSLQVGDIFSFDENALPYLVTAVSDTILLNSSDLKPRKCIHLSRTFNGEIFKEDYHHEVWIEGIGSLNNGIEGILGYMPGGHNVLIKCTKQGNIIYQYQEVTSIQDNRIQSMNDKMHYDIQGRSITNKTKKGIIIQNGRKVVVKLKN